jgi:hypothetical protein
MEVVLALREDFIDNGRGGERAFAVLERGLAGYASRT